MTSATKFIIIAIACSYLAASLINHVSTRIETEKTQLKSKS